MVLIDTQLTASEVLRTFHSDEPFLFLGSAFTTVGIVSAAFCVIRRRLDPLLISMALFAVLYGQRLWFQSALLSMILPNTELFLRLRSIVDFLVPVPAFFFFQFAGLLGRSGKKITFFLALTFLCLVLATSAFGTVPVFHTINNVLVIGALLYMVVASLRGGLKTAIQLFFAAGWFALSRFPYGITHWRQSCRQGRSNRMDLRFSLGRWDT